MSERLAGWLTSLSAKYIALFALLVALPVIGTSIYLLDSSYNDNKRALIHQQQEEAKAIGARLEQALVDAADRLESIRAAGLSRRELDPVLRPLLVSDLTPLAVFYMNRKGKTVLSVGSHSATQSGPGRNADVGVLTPREFAQAKNGVYFSRVYEGRDLFDAPAPYLNIAAPENSGNGVIGEKVYATSFTNLVPVDLASAGYAYAVSSNGLGLAVPGNWTPGGSGSLSVPQTLVRISTPQVREALRSNSKTGSGTGRNFHSRKQEVLTAWTTVEPVGWKVFVEQPKSAAFAPLRGKIWRTALLLAAFLGAAILLSVLLAQRLVRPIKRMQVTAEAIGAGAYGERIELDRRDELGALADSLNRMAASLEELITGLEHKVAERTRELEIASKHKNEFLANMSHELRTPLNAIVGFSQVLRQKLFGDVNEKQEEYLDDILSSADHLLSLINDILDLSKVEAGQVELEVGTFSLREALERGVVMVREKAMKNGVALKLELDPSVDLVDGDERRIRQVVFNLLSNAVKFTPSGGRVDVSTAREDGEVRVAVKDTGAGIARNDQERIFEEFQQAQRTGEDRPEGTGLGLALSRKLVELHGGRIWVDSALGGGSTFTFTLPLG
jgi:signal transduction histidine kinase